MWICGSPCTMTLWTAKARCWRIASSSQLTEQLGTPTAGGPPQTAGLLTEGHMLCLLELQGRGNRPLVSAVSVDKRAGAAQLLLMSERS